MGHKVFTDAFVSVAATDFSADVESVSLDYRSEVQDDTNMGDTSRTRLGGLLDWTLTVNFRQNFAASGLDSVLFPLVGTSVAIILREDNSDGIGAGNPNFTGNAILETYPIFGNSVGEVGSTSVVFSGNGALARATS